MAQENADDEGAEFDSSEGIKEDLNSEGDKKSGEDSLINKSQGEETIHNPSKDPRDTSRSLNNSEDPCETNRYLDNSEDLCC